MIDPFFFFDEFLSTPSEGFEIFTNSFFLSKKPFYSLQLTSMSQQSSIDWESIDWINEDEFEGVSKASLFKKACETISSLKENILKDRVNEGQQTQLDSTLSLQNHSLTTPPTEHSLHTLEQNYLQSQQENENLLNQITELKGSIQEKGDKSKRFSPTLPPFSLFLRTTNKSNRERMRSSKTKTEKYRSDKCISRITNCIVTGETEIYY